jgi:hypothetical protein
MTDLEILNKILEDLHYSEDYRKILIEKALLRLEDSGLDEMTPPFLFVTFVYDLGRATATKIADYFKQMKSEGNYETELEQTLRDSPSFSKFFTKRNSD